MSTPREFLIKASRRRDENLQFRDDDGLFIFAIKALLKWHIWDYAHSGTVWLILYVANALDRHHETGELAASVARRAMDVYTILFTLGLLVAYSLSFIIHGEQKTIWLSVSFAVLSIATIYRVGEILSVLAALHFSPKYSTSAPMRALVVAFVFYFQVVIAFGILYLLIGDLAADSFAAAESPSLADRPLNAIYFSFVTITTLGYGDFSPNSWQGQLLVIAEVAIGIVFIVVIIQRVIALTVN